MLLLFILLAQYGRGFKFVRRTCNGRIRLYHKIDAVADLLNLILGNGRATTGNDGLVC